LGKRNQVAWRDAHAVHRRTLGTPEQQVERERRNLRRLELPEIGIRAWRQMEVRRREARFGSAVGDLETPMPADFHAALGGDLGHRHRTMPRHRIGEGPAAQMDHLDAGRIGAAGGDVLKCSDGHCIGLLVVADAVLTGEPHGALRQPFVRMRLVSASGAIATAVL